MNQTANTRMFVRVQPNSYNPIGHDMLIVPKNQKPYGPYKELIFRDKIKQYPAPHTMEETVIKPQIIIHTVGMFEKAVVTFANEKGPIVPGVKYRVKNLDKLLEQLNRDFAGIGEFVTQDGGNIVITKSKYADLIGRIELS